MREFFVYGVTVRLSMCNGSAWSVCLKKLQRKLDLPSLFFGDDSVTDRERDIGKTDKDVNEQKDKRSSGRQRQIVIKNYDRELCEKHDALQWVSVQPV